MKKTIEETENAKRTRGHAKPFTQEQLAAIFMKPMLTTKEAIIHTGLSKGKLYELAHNNTIRAFRPGGREFFFQREELENYMMSNPYAAAGA